jgi:predicted AAA+ superfamily ATPase
LISILQGMIRRQVQKELLARLAAYPAVALTGPRQCGKTTLAQSLDRLYFDLEQEPERLRLDLEWDNLVTGKDLIILDEAQSWPEVFARLRGAIDKDRRRKGRFLLLGSVSPALMTHVSESLAGRLSLIELTPLLRSELTTKTSQSRHWLIGGYPDGGILKPSAFPRWQLDYLTLLTQRDLPSWGLSAKPQTTDRMLRMLAALHGQTWNASQVGQSLGLSYQTVNGYLDYLEGAFLTRRLKPFQTNIKKRLVKSPKIYWRDSGLLHALMNVQDDRTLLAQPWVGASWEGYLIEQTLGELTSRGKSFDAYYFRTSDGHELDLVLDFGRELWAIEVKLTSLPGPDDMKRLDATADMIGATRRFLVSQTSRSHGDKRRASCNLSSFLEYLRSV